MIQVWLLYCCFPNNPLGYVIFFFFSFFSNKASEKAIHVAIYVTLRYIGGGVGRWLSFYFLCWINKTIRISWLARGEKKSSVSPFQYQGHTQQQQQQKNPDGKFLLIISCVSSGCLHREVPFRNNPHSGQATDWLSWLILVMHEGRTMTPNQKDDLVVY